MDAGHGHIQQEIPGCASLCLARRLPLIPLYFSPQLAVAPEGCFTHLCVQIQIRKPLNLIDHFLLC